MLRYCLILICPFLSTLSFADDYSKTGWHKRVDLSTSYQENISHAWIKDHIRSDNITSIAIGGSHAQLVGDSGMLQFSGYVSHQSFSDFSDMNTNSLSLSADYLFRISHEYHATTYGIGLNVVQSEFTDSEIREGTTYNLTANASKRLTRTVNGKLEYIYSRRNSESETFETTKQYLGASIDFRITDRWVGYAAARYMKGDLLLHALGNPVGLRGTEKAARQTSDPAFSNNGVQSTRFRFSGDAFIQTYGVNYQLTSSTSIDLFWQLYQWETDNGIDEDDSSAQIAMVWSF